MRKRRIVSSKNIKEVLDYHNGRTYKRNSKRREKINATSEAIQKQNEKMAESELRMTIDNNFKSNDYYLTLTYKEQPTWEQAKKDIRNFIRRLQRVYKKLGQELKYIYVAEGKRRIHFHLLINRAVDLFTEDLTKLWPKGIHKLVLYRGQAEDAIRLASYFVKEKRACYYEKNEVFKRRYTSSKNLIKAEVKVETLKSNTWSRYIEPPKGYYVETDSIVDGVSLEGYPYRFYRLIKIRGQ
ncbi:rolling circle replication-associated protein [Veillonella ratti]|uniref:rolling circle replication-associated protein n=1 Tax=Veillonella ratti TaxID=103892 RepID=UPI000F8F09ED|nr:hypothetical protein [Veillonella ratti]